MVEPARVLVVSDHDVMHAGLVSVLSRAGQFAVSPDRSPSYPLQGVDVALWDVVGLHEGRGSDLDKLVKETDAAVLAVTRDLRPDLADRALEKGVDGCISSDWPAERIVEAVHTASTGDLHGAGWPEDLTLNPAATPVTARLTNRESDVLARIVLGMRNEEIAADLYLSINSVKTYIRTAYRRIGVRSRSQAVAWGIQHGYPPVRISPDVVEATADAP